MLTSILISVAVILVGLIIVIATRPSEFHVERTVTMTARPNTVFDQVNDFHNWGPWNPWAKLDPNINITIEGPPSGTGAVYSWKGNGNVGEGRITITESRPADLIRLYLEFFKPFKGINTAEFTFKPQGNQTVVRWTMDGKSNFISKAISMFMSMDKMIGGQFDKGLADIKAVVESKGRS